MRRLSGRKRRACRPASFAAAAPCSCHQTSDAGHGVALASRDAGTANLVRSIETVGRINQRSTATDRMEFLGNLPETDRNEPPRSRIGLPEPSRAGLLAPPPDPAYRHSVFDEDHRADRGSPARYGRSSPAVAAPPLSPVQNRITRGNQAFAQSGARRRAPPEAAAPAAAGDVGSHQPSADRPRLAACRSEMRRVIVDHSWQQRASGAFAGFRTDRSGCWIGDAACFRTARANGGS